MLSQVANVGDPVTQQQQALEQPRRTSADAPVCRAAWVPPRLDAPPG